MSAITTDSPNLAAEQAAADDLVLTAVEAPKTILLLDGARLFLKLEETLLQRRGWTILTASSGAEAKRIMGEQPVDLLLTDYALPDTTGDEVVGWVRANPATKDIGVLIVTARGMREHVDRSMRAGCNSFLFKPVSRGILSARVQELLKVPARRHVRTLVRLEVKAQCRDRFFFGNSVNLSASGLLIESNLALALGESISVRFFLPGDERAVNAEGRVVRSVPAATPGTSSYGLVFDRVSTEDRSRLEMFVDTSLLFEPEASTATGA